MATLPRSDQVAAVILAAGTSSRLGRPKQLLDIYGEPVIRRIARTVCASLANPVLIVAGSLVDEIASSTHDLPVTIVPNPDFASGQASSFRAGLRAAPDAVGAVVFALGDMPGLQSNAIDRVIDQWRQDGTPVVQARYRGTRSHPVLVDRSLFPELLLIEGDTGAAPVLRAHRDEIVLVDFDEDVPMDIDTEDDYQAVLARL